MNNRPHVIVNIAMTIDGKLDTFERNGATISSKDDKNRVDVLRASVDAILVGGKTLLSEDPSLTVKSKDLRTQRLAKGLEENPVKIAVVSQADLDLQGEFITAGPARQLIYTTKRTAPEKVHLLEKAGAQVFVCCDESIDLRDVLQSLFDHGIRTLLVEGGGTVIAEFFNFDLVDELKAYIAPIIFSGSTAPTPADGPGFSLLTAKHLHLESVCKFDDEGGILVHYLR
ncbi:MAG: 2,5-diamino-6-(ribosylamino)-4(3H)-pyrimidinone 5'-phosphate reductase [Chloroflexota bacterium]